MRSSFWFVQLVLPCMRKNKKGVIVNMASIAAIQGGGIFGGSHYAASKAAVMGLTRALARELGPEQIRVNAVAPTFIDTGLFKGAIDDERKAQFAYNSTLKRVGVADDVAGVMLFVASDLSSYVTGEVVKITGGAHIG